MVGVLPTFYSLYNFAYSYFILAHTYISAVAECVVRGWFGKKWKAHFGQALLPSPLHSFVPGITLMESSSFVHLLICLFVHHVFVKTPVFPLTVR